MKPEKLGPINLLCMPPGAIPELWPKVAHLIDRAIISGSGDEGLDQVYAKLLRGLALLWVAWDDPKRDIVAIAATELLETRRGKVCMITLCAGRDLKRWSRFIGDLEQFARDEGCQFMRIYGREGWRRVLTGYRQPWIALERRLGDVGRDHSN